MVMGNQSNGNRNIGSGIALILIAFAAYIALGLPDGLLGVAWPSMRKDFALPLDSLGALLTAFTIGYLTASFFGGRILTRIRLGVLLAASTSTACAALLGYALSPGWWAMVTAGLVAGLGGGAIDVAMNTYAATYHGVRFMQWLHACYGIGATLGPIIMTASVGFLGSWRWGYAMVGGFQFVLAVSFIFTASLWEMEKKASSREKNVNHSREMDTPMRITILQPRVWLSVFIFFVYMGIEFTLGTWGYTLLTESRGIPVRLAGLWMGSYWGIFTIGRIFAGLFASRVRQSMLIIGSILVAMISTLFLAWDVSNGLNLISVTVIGLAIAPVFPSLISGTSDRVGISHTANTIGIQFAATGVGGAAIPSLTGILAQRFSLEVIPGSIFFLIIVFIGAFFLSLRLKMGKS